MNQQISQTNIQLFNQLFQAEYSEQDIESVFNAYELVRNIFSGTFRGAGKTFISHLIGTTSVLVSLKSPIPVVNAALLHAAYSDGQFTGEKLGISRTKRQHLRQVIGEEAEFYVYKYTDFPWRRAGGIPEIIKRVNYLDSVEKTLVLMRLANELEENLDLGILYCDNAEERLKFIEIYGDSIVDIAHALDYPVLANCLKKSFEKATTVTIPMSLRSQPNSRYTYLGYRGAMHSPQQILPKEFKQPNTDIAAKELLNFQPFEKSEIEQSINRRFESQVAQYPHHIAVKTSDQKLTYDALNQAANRLARQILQQCSPEQELVPILFEDGASMLIAILGVLKAGKGWVPLAASYPQVRLETILSELNASVLITNQRNLNLAEVLLANREKIINIDKINPHLSPDNLDICASANAIACVLYTSGSTGKPKGVIHSHRNLLHLIRRGTNSLKIDANDRLSLIPSYSHIGGTNNIFRALLNGAMLLPYNLNERGLVGLETWLIEEKITIYHSVPTVFRHFIHTLKEDDTFPDIRAIHLGGEPVYKYDVDLFKQYFSNNCLLLNNLGCTELSSYRQYFISSDTELPSNIVPVGYKTEDVEVLLLDENGEEVATGSIGEVVLRSSYLALGYWKQPEQTNAAFFTDKEFPEQRCYKTGDIGYFLPDGCLINVGRKDFQVQIRGYRVEIGEIEAALFEHPKIKETAVKYEDNEGEKRLVGYVVPTEGEHLSSKELHNHLKQYLPDYMIPGVFVMLGELPLTPNGKVSRLELPKTKQETVSKNENYIEPRTNIEKTLVSIWSQILNIKQISLDDNFFLLGGDSLQAMRVVSKVRSQLNIEVPLRSLFEFPTAIEWAKQIDSMTWFSQENSDAVESWEVENWEEIEL